ncbi:invasion associated locus B family protein [Pelagibius sp. CAU 1746]|uniref:invasion associated locus B family protein n=1 Tax=Pelagibius sp. CAU 1746 TaxID=3140370 RepID=UPI00325A95E4
MGLAGPAAAQVQLQIPDQPAPQGQAPQGQAPQGQAPQGQAPALQAPAGSGPAVPSAASQPQRFGDWVRRCTADPPPEASPPPAGKQEVCFLVQQVVVQNAQKPVLSITIGFFGPEHQSLAIIDTQLRVPLAHGIRVGVDGKEVGGTPFEFCHQQGCRAFLPLSAEIVSAFKAGNSGAVQMRSSGGEPVNLPISLKGFTAGFGSLE